VRSIRLFLCVVLVSVICLSNFIAALQGYRSSLAAAEELIELQIMEKGQFLSSLIQGSISLPADIFDEKTYFQVWRGGELLDSSSNAPSSILIDARDGHHFVSFNGRRWRMWVFSINVTNAERNEIIGSTVKAPIEMITIVIAQRGDLYFRLTESILLKAIYPIIWVLPIIGLLVWGIVTFGLRPLSRLANVLNDRVVEDFSALDSREYPDEMHSIVRSLNQLFDRLREAFNRERRLSADAAHELRTPLAALKIGLHNMKASATEDKNLDRLQSSVDRMGHSVEQILTLHRMSSEVSHGEMSDCDIQLIARDTIAGMFSQFEARRQHIELDAESTMLYGDAFSLSVLIRNLIDNAGKYTPESGTVRVTVSKLAGAVRLFVEDSGFGIPIAERERVLERFYRVSGDRHSSGIEGSGLGLSIVSSIVRLHEGKLRLTQSEALGGLGVEIVFPQIKQIDRDNDT
jgi:two-component system, OmpR family, sensor histidine kinase QseC